MEIVELREYDREEKDRPPKHNAADVAGDYLKSWPVPLPVPMRSLYLKGNRQRRSYRFKYSYVKNWLIPLDGPMSIDHIHFLLDCFVVSAGPVPPQLGRYHPQSNPEQYVRKDTCDKPDEDKCDKEPIDENCGKEPTDENCDKEPIDGNCDDEHIDDNCDNWSFNSVEENNHPWLDDVAPPLEFDAGPSSRADEDGDDYTFENYFPHDIHASKYINRRPMRAFSEFTVQDDIIVRELSEMRLVLERLLDNHEIMEWDHPHGLRDVLDLLPDDVSPQEPQPHYPVGDWEYDECGVCFESQWLYRRPCCRFPACASCLQIYFSSKVENGQVKIECCNNGCEAFVHRDEVSDRLVLADKEKFHKLLVLANQDANTKTCPRCSHLTKVTKTPKNKKDTKNTCVTCPSCELEWCFKCHAPWHGTLTCKQFRKGDRLLRKWAKGRNHGQLNAQKCPRCKIYIERTTGCDHMHCMRCKTDFCYKCGERFRYMKFFGDHYSKLSVFGCKYRFKADQPLQRKVIRGAIFGGKIIAAPVLGALALCAGALAVGISIFALPVYGGVRLYRHCEGRQASKIIRRHPPTYHIPNVSLRLSHTFP